MSDIDKVTLQPGQTIRPIMNLNQAKELIYKYFGYKVINIKELNSYDDKNYYVEVLEGEGSNPNLSASNSDAKIKKYTLKVLNSMDSKKPGHVEAEHEMMFLLDKKGIKCPIPQKTLQGNTFSLVTIPKDNAEVNDNPSAEDSVHLIRLLTFVEGTILFQIPIGPSLLCESGAYIARMDVYLKELRLPVLETHSTLWMLANALEVEKFTYVIQNDEERFKMVQSVLNAYRTTVAPLVHTLEKGIIHGDFNEQNIIGVKKGDGEDYEIAGVIDFGDAHVGPYVFELAITICYMMLESVRCKIVDPFEAAGHVVAGYSTVRNVPDKELELLRILVSCRLSKSLVMGAYANSEDPENKYVLTTADRGWTLLRQIWKEKSNEQFTNICRQFLTK